MTPRTPPEARFWTKVDKGGPYCAATDSNCWLWLAATDRGYGQFWSGSGMMLAHRWSYLTLVGEIPEGMHLDHRCHHRNCVNPAHLRPVTNKQNGENRSGARRDSKSGILGVTWDSRIGKWVGAVQHNGKQTSRSFSDKERAHEWVVARRNELFTHNDSDKRVEV